MTRGIACRLADVGVTLLCWAYFTLGFVIFFSPFYLLAACVPPRTEYCFQRLNSIFYRGFFLLLRAVAPRLSWRIDPQLGNIRSSVVVCNHLSYLDPLLLIAQFPRAKTVVKPVFFAVPVFGWVLRKAGYFPAASTGRHGGLMIRQMESMADYLREGGNFFIFPQGTRRRDGRIGELNEGAFKIARFCNVPMYIVCLNNTGKVFTPGKFFFNTTTPTQIEMRLAGRIDPEPAGRGAGELENRVRAVLESCLD